MPKTKLKRPGQMNMTGDREDPLPKPEPEEKKERQLPIVEYQLYLMGWDETETGSAVHRREWFRASSHDAAHGCVASFSGRRRDSKVLDVRENVAENVPREVLVRMFGHNFIRKSRQGYIRLLEETDAKMKMRRSARQTANSS